MVIWLIGPQRITGVKRCAAGDDERGRPSVPLWVGEDGNHNSLVTDRPGREADFREVNPSGVIWPNITHVINGT